MSIPVGSVAELISGNIADMIRNYIRFPFIFADHYGAKGDGGKTDNAVPIQRALNAAKDAGGGTVILSMGDYYIGSTLLIASNITFMGMGEETKLYTDVPKINGIITEYPSAGIVIEKMKVRGSGYGTQPPNTQGNPDVTNSGSGIVFRQTTRGRIADCIIENWGGDRSTPDKNGVAGVWLTYGCTHCYVYRNIVDVCRNGLNEDNYYGIDPVGNRFEQNKVNNCQFGFATDCADQARGCHVIDNDFFNCAYGGVDINKTKQVLVAFNRFTGCGNTGVPGLFADACNVYGTANFQVSDVRVVHNEFFGNYGRAVRCVVNTYYCKVNDNTVRDCLNKDGMLIQGSRYTQCTGNIISNIPNGHGIVYQESIINGSPVPADQAIISNNTIHQVGKHGIYAEGLAGSVINANRISNAGTLTPSTFGGIHLTLQSSNNTITNNIITGPDLLYGIRGEDSGSIDNVVGSNFITGPIMLNKVSFTNNQQYFTPSGDVRLMNGPVIKGGTSVDVKTNTANLYLPASNGAVPSGTTGGAIMVDESAKVLYVNFGGTWYKTAALTLA